MVAPIQKVQGLESLCKEIVLRHTARRKFREDLHMEADLSNLTSKPTGYYESLREDMLKYIPVGVRTTLEIGCGYGMFSALVKEALHTETWAIEIDKAAAQEAATKLDRVICADAVESLTKIPDNYFDCIILFDILEHLVDPYSMLLTVKTKLTKNGIIIASIPNIRYYRTLKDLVIHGNWDYQDQGILDKTHLRFFTRKSILKMFDSLGYEILLLEGIHPTYSRTYKLLNMLLFNAISDVRYVHFAIVAKPKRQSI